MNSRMKKYPEKNRVKVRHPSAAIVLADTFVREIFRAHGVECIITSIEDGKHSKRSKHYRGDAFDYRTWHLSPDIRDSILTETRRVLSDDYQVVLESEEDRYGEHMHVEFDPLY